MNIEKTVKYFYPCIKNILNIDPLRQMGLKNISIYIKYKRKL